MPRRSSALRWGAPFSAARPDAFARLPPTSLPTTCSLALDGCTHRAWAAVNLHPALSHHLPSLRTSLLAPRRAAAAARGAMVVACAMRRASRVAIGRCGEGRGAQRRGEGECNRLRERRACFSSLSPHNSLPVRAPPHPPHSPAHTPCARPCLVWGPGGGVHADTQVRRGRESGGGFASGSGPPARGNSAARAPPAPRPPARPPQTRLLRLEEAVGRGGQGADASARAGAPRNGESALASAPTPRRPPSPPPEPPTSAQTDARVHPTSCGRRVGGG